jgi:hypothetical protein
MFFEQGSYDPATVAEGCTRLAQIQGATLISSNQYFVLVTIEVSFSDWYERCWPGAEFNRQQHLLLKLLNHRLRIISRLQLFNLL